MSRAASGVNATRCLVLRVLCGAMRRANIPLFKLCVPPFVHTVSVRGCEDFGEFADKFVRGDAVRTVKSSNNAAVLSPRVSYTNSNAIMTSVAEGEMVIFMMAECGGCVRVKKKLLELPDEGVHVYIINVETDEVEDVEVGMVPVMFERGSGGLLQVGGVEAIVDWCKAEGSKPGVSDNKGEL